MSKSDNTNRKYKTFREFYEDDDNVVKPKKPPKENKKNRLKVKQKLKNIDPSDFNDDEFYDDEFFK